MCIALMPIYSSVACCSEMRVVLPPHLEKKIAIYLTYEKSNTSFLSGSTKPISIHFKYLITLCRINLTADPANKRFCLAWTLIIPLLLHLPNRVHKYSTLHFYFRHNSVAKLCLYLHHVYLPVTTQKLL